MEFIIKSKKYGEFKVLIDNEDWERVSKYNWFVGKQKGNKFRVSTNKIKGTQKRLHRFILNIEEGNKLQVDHINGDPLDNRKCNLRIIDNKSNSRNQSLRIKNTSGYKGVSWDKRVRKFEAYIHVDYKKISLGFFNKKEDAAKIYNEAALKYFGDYAKLNIIESLSKSEKRR